MSSQLEDEIKSNVVSDLADPSRWCPFAHRRRSSQVVNDSYENANL